MENLQILLLIASFLMFWFGIILTLYSIIIHFIKNRNLKNYNINNSKFRFIYYGLIGIVLLNNWQFISKIIFISIIYLVNKFVSKKRKENDLLNQLQQKIKTLPKRKILINGFIGVIVLLSGFNPILLISLLLVFLTKKYLLPKVNKTKLNFNKKKLIIPIAVGSAILLVVFVNNRINNYKENQINSHPINSYLNNGYYNSKSNNHQLKSSRDNRSNQLNTNNNSYYQSRGYNSKSDYDYQLKSSRDNRSNQLNSNNNSYYQSRGYNSTSDYNHQQKSSRDNRSNQMNPNNNSSGNTYSSGNAASNNRSNQMNPNNSAYKGGKK